MVLKSGIIHVLRNAIYKLVRFYKFPFLYNCVKMAGKEAHYVVHIDVVGFFCVQEHLEVTDVKFGKYW